MSTSLHPDSSPAFRYDLLDVLQALYARRRFILLLTGLALLAGLLSYFLKKPNYKARAEVLLSNPTYTDRARVFSQWATAEYFANEQINDRALAIANSDASRQEIIRRNQLGALYKVDLTKPGGMERVMKALDRDLTIRRTEFGSILITFSAESPEKAAAVANSSVEVVQEQINSYLGSLRQGTRQALSRRIQEADSAIAVLTDTLVALRERSGIYDIISPNRYGLTIGNMRSTDARAIEEIQNLESIKDQYVIDRARYMATASENSVDAYGKDLQVLGILSKAQVPGKRAGMGLVFTLLTYALAGLLVSILWVALSSWMRHLAGALAARAQVE